MHIAVDAVGTRHSGGLTVLEGILVALAKREEVRRVSVFCSPGLMVRDFGTDKFYYVVRTGEEQPWRRLIWPSVTLPRQIKRYRADVLLSMSGTGCAPKSVPAAVLVQQALALTDSASAKGRLKDVRMKVIALLMARACRRAAIVVTQTPEIADAVKNRFGVPSNRVRSWLPTPPWGVARSRPHGSSVEIPTLLYVGNDADHKDLPTLFEGVGKLRQEIPARLVTAGAWSRPRPEEGLVEHYGLLSHADVRRLYEAADVLVMPSRVETVGLPLLEAMSLGVPVVTVDLPYARRVCGVAAAYFAAGSADALCAALRRVLADPGEAARLSAAGISRAIELNEAQGYDHLVSTLVSLSDTHAGKRESSFNRNHEELRTTNA